MCVRWRRVRGDGNFTVSGVRYPFASRPARSVDATHRVHLKSIPRPRILRRSRGHAELRARAPRFDGTFPCRTAGLKPRRHPDHALEDFAKARRSSHAGRSARCSYARRRTRCGFRARRHQLRRRAAISCGAVGAAARCRQVHRWDNAPSRCDCCGFACADEGYSAGTDTDADRGQLRTIMLGGRPVQNLPPIRQRRQSLEHRPAGFSRSRLNAGVADRQQFASRSRGFSGALAVESSDPDALTACCRAAASRLRSQNRCGCTAMSASSRIASPSTP